MSFWIVVLSLGQPFDDADLAARFGYEDSVKCRACHPRHFAEWIGSTHAAVSRRFIDPHARPSPAAGAPGRPDAADFQDPSCSPCHMGDLTLVLGERTPRFPVRLDHAAERTITCTVCHQIDAIPDPPPEGAPDYDPRPPAERRGYFHRARPVPELERAALCGPCHQVAAPNGLPVERTWSQYLGSAYPEREITCVSCHMSSYGGTFVPGGAFREQAHRHDFIGADAAFNMVPAMGPQRERVAAFLTAAAAMFVSAPAAVQAGASFELSVEVVNSGAGHNFPAGFPEERRLWLEVELAADSGSIIHEFGGNEGSQVSGGEPGAIRIRGPGGGANFTDRFLDAAGGEVLSWEEATRIDERSLRPSERRRTVFEVPVPAEMLHRRIEIAVRLRFQAASPRRLRRQGLEHLASHYPIFDVRSFRSGTIPVVESILPAGWIRVPEDAADLQAAVRAVPEGGGILVGPGTWILREPIRFGGRNFTLKSAAGPEATILRLDAPADGPAGAGSVVLFSGGETRSARIEGFTITGGRGTLLDGSRRGGGICADGASPVIASNWISGNHADGGGGIFLRHSAARLEKNRLSGNTAEGDGGGAAFEACRGLELAENEAFHNIARRSGGGLYFADSPARLEGWLIQGNQARQGGGIAVEDLAAPGAGAGDAGGVWIQDARILGNAAPLGGGLSIVQAPARILRTLVAGNTARAGGAALLDGAQPVVFEHATLTENSAASSGTFYCRKEARPLVRDSILWGNAPSGLLGDITHSLVDDERYSGGAGNRSGLPLFQRAPGIQAPCSRADEPGCVPTRWQRAAGGEWQPGALARWVPGEYQLLISSPAINSGDPDDPADPDGTRADMGAFYRPLPLRGFIRGDADGNGRIEAADGLKILEVMFGPAGSPCLDAADLDDRSGIEPVDAALLFAFLFHLGPPPAAPFPKCGVDPTPADGLACSDDQPGCR